MTCAKKSSTWVTQRLEREHHERGPIQVGVRTKLVRKVEIPVCKEHSSFWSAKSISTDDFDDQGAWTVFLHRDFLAALKKHRKMEVKAWQEENEGADPEDFDEELLPPGLRTEPEIPERSNAGLYIGATFFIVIMGVVVLGSLAVCIIMGLVMGFGIFAGRR